MDAPRAAQLRARAAQTAARLERTAALLAQTETLLIDIGLRLQPNAPPTIHGQSDTLRRALIRPHTEHE